LDWIRNDAQIRFVLVHEASGERVASLQPANADGITIDTSAVRAQDVRRAGTLMMTTPIVRENKRLGTLVVGFSLHDLENEVRATQLTTLLVCGVLLAL